MFVCFFKYLQIKQSNLHFKRSFKSLTSLHPPKQTWNLEMDPWKRRFLLETIMSRFHVNFWGCNFNWFYWTPILHYFESSRCSCLDILNSLWFFVEFAGHFGRDVFDALTQAFEWKPCFSKPRELVMMSMWGITRHQWNGPNFWWFCIFWAASSRPLSLIITGFLKAEIGFKFRFLLAGKVGFKMRWEPTEIPLEEKQFFWLRSGWDSDSRKDGRAECQ